VKLTDYFVVLILVLYLLLLAGSPAVSRAAISPPAALGADSDYVNSSIKALPAWIEASEARLEWQEIEAIQQDTDDCLTAVDPDAFHKDVEKLRADWGKLVALDNKLKKEFQL
jgi:hypothetical protein